MAQTEYNNKSIELLQFPANLRQNASMYLGSTDEHGRWLIARELLDNGLDEALAGRNKGNFFVEDPDGSYWVMDFGAGIPQGSKTFEINVNGKVIKNTIPTMQAIFTEMHTSGKFKSDAYQNSVGCFVGDTYVTLCDGNAIRIEELYRAWEKGQREFYLPSVSPETGKFLYKDKITHVQLSKYMNELICVEIDGYIQITCTPDHPFYNLDLKKVKAEDLKVDDELFDTTFKDKFYGGPKVTNITKMSLAVAVPVYGITVETNHTYMVGGDILVSNTHGVGAKGTNATSEFFEVYTYFQNEWYSIKFKKGILTSPVTKLSEPPKGPFGITLKKGTCIHFKPDATIFGGSSISLDHVRQWAEITSYLTPGFSVMVVEKDKSKTRYFSKEGPKEYVNKLLSSLKGTAEKIYFEHHSNLCDIVIAFSDVENCNVRGYTNGLYNSEGGKHVDSIISCLYDSAKKYIKSKQSFSIYNFKEGLVGLVNIKLHKAEFSSQDKSRLTDSRAGDSFKEILQKETDKFFATNKPLALRLCEKASKLSQLMDQFKASKKVVTALNNVKRKGLPSKYAPYDSRTKIEDRELLIVEGNSAGGGIREERMPWQSLLPLRGKILNVKRSGKNEKALESEEIINILGAIGYDPKASDPLSKLQVSKVICLADADPDGPVSADTLVYTNKGQLTIKEIIKEWEKGINYYSFDRLRVYAYDEEKRETILADINWAGITCTRTIEYEITFSNGFTVECTDSHKWAIYNEDKCSIEYVRTDSLELGDSIVGLSSDGNTCFTINSITKKILPREKNFYCLDICGLHNFYVADTLGNKYLCHNCHINALLLTLFHTYLPEMFDRGMIYVADMPEFYSIYKDKFFSGNTLSEVRAKMNEAKVPNSVEINHIKGWGEIDACLMKILAIDPNTRKLIRIQAVTKNQETVFNKLMTDDVEFRKELLGLAKEV